MFFPLLWKKKKKPTFLQGVQGFQATVGSKSCGCFIKFAFHFQHAPKPHVNYNEKRGKNKEIELKRWEMIMKSNELRASEGYQSHRQTDTYTVTKRETSKRHA